MARSRDPRTKQELLDRMLSFDFDGDIRHLGVEPATIQRVSPNTLRLKFPDSDQVFDLTVHKPREFAKVAKQTRTFREDRDERDQGDEPEAPRGRRVARKAQPSGRQTRRARREAQPNG